MTDIADIPTAQLLQMLHEKAAPAPSPIAANPATDYGGDTLHIGPLDTGIHLGQAEQNFLAGAGKAYVDTLHGAEQLTGLGAPDLQAKIDQSRELDAPLMHTGAGFAGNFAGNTALTLPAYLVPGVNTYLGATAAGAAQGALAPTVTGESRLGNVVAGGVSGLAGQGLGRGIGRLVRPITPALSPEDAALAAKADEYGIPLRLSQVTGSRPLAVTESVLETLPFSSEGQLAERTAQQRAFTRAVLQKAGIEGDSATAPVLATRKGLLGATFTRLARNASLDFNQGLGDHLADIVGEASQHLPPDQAARVGAVADNILKQVGPDGTMLGSNYQGWREPLRRMAKSGNEYAHYAGEIRRAMDSAFARQLGPELAPQWAEASGQYGVLKQIMRAMGGAGAATKGGVIPPSQLESALTATVGREGKALGRGSLNDLASVGRRYVGETLPDSGTAMRNFYVKALTGAAPGALAGGAYGYYDTGTPQGALEWAGLGAAGDLGLSFLTPMLAQKALSSGLARGYLTRGIVPLSQPSREMLAHALRTATISAVPTLEAAQ